MMHIVGPVRIKTRLDRLRGWPVERVPMIWPCGRRRDAFPQDVEETRRALRRELGIGPDVVVFFTAARMHPQKRPLDLVAPPLPELPESFAKDRPRLRFPRTRWSCLPIHVGLPGIG